MNTYHTLLFVFGIAILSSNICHSSAAATGEVSWLHGSKETGEETHLSYSQDDEGEKYSAIITTTHNWKLAALRIVQVTKTKDGHYHGLDKTDFRLGYHPTPPLDPEIARDIYNAFDHKYVELKTPKK